MAHTVEDIILSLLKEKEELDSMELLKHIQAQDPKLIENHQALHSIFLSLESLGLIILKNKSSQCFQLSDEGILYSAEGTPEYNYAKIISEKPGMPTKEATAFVAQKIAGCYTKQLPTKVEALANNAFGKAKQCKYIEIKGGNVVLGNIEHDIVKETLNQFLEDQTKVSTKEFNELKKRKLVVQVVKKWFGVIKGSKYVESMDLVRKPIKELTEDMVKSGEWENVDFAPLNFDALGAKIGCGHEHPLLRVRYEFRQIFFQMGFEEMDTSKWVESSFWNFDTLFQGQQHPCRDMHDTFFIKNPELAHKIEDQEYFYRVKEFHEKGGMGSIGLRYDFNEKVPLMNIMRTHTTAVSSRYLKHLADEYKRTGILTPHKYFSIDRVYRNETLDATHLAEFFQVEGFVIDKNLSLADLMSYIKQFFSRIGLTEIEFKPAYNPYTEPSMEIFAKHEGLGKWIEIGNSGMFRPEMLNPMGIPPEYNVIAWGFSLERPTMIEFKIDEIRKLEGPLVSLDLIENCPIARLTF